MKRKLTGTKPKVALIICTRNNPEKLKVSLSYLFRRLPTSISFALIDQSTQYPIPNTYYALKRSITLIRKPLQHGLSKARNTAIKSIDADVLAWTDDDCILGQSYGARLSAIAKLAPDAERLKIAGVCGRTLPYLPTRPSPAYSCPCTFSKSNARPIQQVCSHWKYVGFGNNMVIFKHVFEELGYFKEWLGTGAIGESGEDGEFMIRCLAAGYQFLYDPDLLIYHNKWLDDDNPQTENQMRQYTCGGLALYGFYMFQGLRNCQSDFLEEVRSSLKRVGISLKNAIRHPRSAPYRFHSCMLDSYYLLKGVLLAFLYARVIPIPAQENVLRSRKLHPTESVV